MSSTVILVFVCCFITTSLAASTVTTESNLVDMTLSPSPVSVQPNVTINCTCTVALKNGELIIPGLVLSGPSDKRCDRMAFMDCKAACETKTSNELIFSIDSQSVGLNLPNAVNLHDYLCGLNDRKTMVVITSKMDCSEESTNYELFNSQFYSNGISLTSINCPPISTSTKSTISL